MQCKAGMASDSGVQTLGTELGMLPMEPNTTALCLAGIFWRLFSVSTIQTAVMKKNPARPHRRQGGICGADSTRLRPACLAR